VSPATSIYLDFIRFSAAAVVFVGHTSGQLFTGGFLWQLGGYTRTAVIVFFVLSGYVIAHVLATRETSLRSYAASRFGRLYSVIVPALALTIFCDYIGLQRDPAFYYNGPWGYPDDNVAWRYITTTLLINRWWAFSGNGGMEPGINVPFWSLSFEAAYYCAIAILVFWRGWLKIVALLLLALLSGPSIVILAPLWFLGYFLYHAPKYWKPTPAAALALIVIGGAVLLMSSRLRQLSWLMAEVRFIDNKTLVMDYIDAVAFTIHLAGFGAVGSSAESLLRPLARVFAWLGSLTFALYLFHRPLIQVLAVYSIGEPSSWQQRLWVFGGTLLIVATLGRLCERQKGAYRRVFLRALPAFTAVERRRTQSV
jgi:peptidoglycan/LPS O-acetylase OafA/YrhL